jgi:hypothetical protein
VAGVGDARGASVRPHGASGDDHCEGKTVVGMGAALLGQIGLANLGGFPALRGKNRRSPAEKVTISTCLHFEACLGFAGRSIPHSAFPDAGKHRDWL